MKKLNGKLSHVCTGLPEIYWLVNICDLFKVYIYVVFELTTKLQSSLESLHLIMYYTPYYRIFNDTLHER